MVKVYNESEMYFGTLFDFCKEKPIERKYLDTSTLPYDNPVERMLNNEYMWSYEDERNEIIQEVKNRSKTKTYHYGNLEKGLYVYSIKNDEGVNLFFQNIEYVIRLDYTINDLTSNLRFAACVITWYKPDGTLADDYLRDRRLNDKGLTIDHRDDVILRDWGFNKITNADMFCSFEFTLEDLQRL